jgi:hypothetical protein
MLKLREMLIPALLSATCGALVNYTLLPLYIAADWARPVPFLGKPPTYLTAADVIEHGWIIIGYGFFLLGPLLWLFRQRKRTALLIYLAYPWGFMAIADMLFTRPEGLWYRGYIQAAADFSMPLLQGLLSASLYHVSLKKMVR